MSSVFSFTEDDLARIPARPENSHKGTFGRVLIFAGSSGMAGAAFFCAAAAYRSGAGLVELVSPEENRVIVQTLLPEALFTACTPRPEWKVLRRSLDRATVVVIGPGLGVSEDALRLLSFVLENVACPLVIDADALNLLAKNPALLSAHTDLPTLITPHPGEMARLLGRTTADLAGEDPVITASGFADRQGVICLLKSSHTVVARPHDERIYQNPIACSALAKGGSGDVLCGVIAALAAQGVGLFDAACLGSFVHSLAGQCAAQRLSSYSPLARDVIDAIPAVLRRREML